MRRENQPQGGGILPAGYTQLQYIESTGTQYITIAGYRPSTACTIKAKYMLNPNDGTNNYTIIFQSGTSGNYRMLILARGNGPGGDGALDYAWGAGYKTASLASSAYDANVWHEVEMKYQTLIMDGSSYSIISTNNITPNSDLTLFSSPGGSNRRAHKLAKFECAWSGGDVELYSALRDQDSKPGLYDIINNQFYTNNGTGEFLYA